MMHRLSILLFALLLAGCELFTPQPDFKPYDRIAAVPQDFLFTTHEPFNSWLDTPVYVQMVNVPLINVFEHPALQPLSYRWVTFPRLRPYVNIYRVAITRRQLLWSIAHDHKLTMLPVIVPGGVSYIEVRAQDLWLGRNEALSETTISVDADLTK